MRLLSRCPRVGAIALVAALDGACVRVPLDLDPPPALSFATVAPPARPTVQREGTGFDPSVTVKRAGAARIALPRKALAILPFTSEAYPGLRDALIGALLDAGFTDVVDLDAATQVQAGWATSLHGGQVELTGKMHDVLAVAPIHRADATLHVEWRALPPSERRLPVRRWVDPAALEAYVAAAATYDAARRPILEAIGEAVLDYRTRFNDAIERYERRRAPWQAMLEENNPPEEYGWLDRYKAAARERVEAMPDPASAEDIVRAASSGQGEEVIAVRAGTVRATVRDSANGRVLAVFDIDGAALDQASLNELLLEALVDALGAA